MVDKAAAARKAERAIVRPLTGAVLKSPKQPQPTSGFCARSSIRALVATRKSRPAPSRTQVAGAPAPILPAVTIRPIPRPHSMAHMVIASGRRSRIGNKAVGPSPSVADPVRIARPAFAV
jgi:hypothetical protein